MQNEEGRLQTCCMWDKYSNMGGSGGDTVNIYATFLRAEDADALLGAVVDQRKAAAVDVRCACVAIINPKPLNPKP